MTDGKRQCSDVFFAHLCVFKGLYFLHNSVPPLFGFSASIKMVPQLPPPPSSMHMPLLPLKRSNQSESKEETKGTNNAHTHKRHSSMAARVLTAAFVVMCCACGWGNYMPNILCFLRAKLQDSGLCLEDVTLCCIAASFAI